MSPNTMHHQTLDLRIEKVTEDGSGVEESAERARVLVSWVEYEEAGSQGQSDLGISPALLLIGCFTWERNHVPSLK